MNTYELSSTYAAEYVAHHLGRNGNGYVVERIGSDIKTDATEKSVNNILVVFNKTIRCIGANAVAKRQRTPTPAAQAAKIIRQNLKKNGIKASVRSSNFSMGSSVTVKVTDLPPAALKAIEKYCTQYKYGHFDGMQDMYINNNRRPDIPQTKFLTIKCEYSPEMKQKAWDHLRARLGRLKGAPSSYEKADQFYDDRHESGDMLLQHALQGRFGQDYGFWVTQKPRIRVKT